ncbi:MAG: aminopeptidase P family protein [Anaerolineae bacterium]|nr:aminopeptidase P family protein [Anaerolineae bacterium]
MQVDYSARLQKLYSLFGFDRASVDVIVLVTAQNLEYLCGVSFHMSERPLLAFYRPGKDPVWVIPILDMPKIEAKAPYPITFFPYTDAEGVEVALKRAADAMRLFGNKIGVEGLKMRYWESQLLRRYAHPTDISSLENWLSKLRLHKDAAAIEATRKAVQIAEQALETVLSEVRPGMTERQIARKLSMTMSDLGGAEDAFSTMVLSGAKSGEPHGNTGNDLIQEGELLLFDFGTKVDGYCSDITRTFVVGQPREELVKMYAAVLAANEAGRKASAPGVPAQEVDRITRKVIEDAGYGQYFIHRTGHGLGMDVHEEPQIKEGNATLLEPGMLFTIEPGVYLPGVGGVRIEDNVLITESGAETLTTFPRELRSIGS